MSLSILKALAPNHYLSFLKAKVRDFPMAVIQFVMDERFHATPRKENFAPCLRAGIAEEQKAQCTADRSY